MGDGDGVRGGINEVGGWRSPCKAFFFSVLFCFAVAPWSSGNKTDRIHSLWCTDLSERSEWLRQGLLKLPEGPLSVNWEKEEGQLKWPFFFFFEMAAVSLPTYQLFLLCRSTYNPIPALLTHTLIGILNANILPWHSRPKVSRCWLESL